MKKNYLGVLLVVSLALNVALFTVCSVQYFKNRLTEKKEASTAVSNSNDPANDFDKLTKDQKQKMYNLVDDYVKRSIERPNSYKALSYDVKPIKVSIYNNVPAIRAAEEIININNQIKDLIKAQEANQKILAIYPDREDIKQQLKAGDASIDSLQAEKIVRESIIGRYNNPNEGNTFGWEVWLTYQRDNTDGFQTRKQIRLMVDSKIGSIIFTQPTEKDTPQGYYAVNSIIDGIRRVSPDMNHLLPESTRRPR